MAIIMVGSIIGFVGLSGLSDASGNATPPEGVVPDNVPSQTTSVTMQAHSVQVTVEQIFPTAILVGETTAFNVSEINASLLKIDGVVSADTSFNSNTGNSIITNLRLSDSSNGKAVLVAAQGIESLSNVQLFPRALIVLPEKTEFSNQDLGVTQDYRFPDHKAEAIVLLETMAGDLLNVSIEANFQNETIIGKPFIVEQNNLTASPAYYSVDDTFTISSVDNQFYLIADANLSQKATLEEIQASFESAFDESNLSIRDGSNVLIINFKNPETIFEGDLNTFFSSFDGIDSFDIQLDSGYASVNFTVDDYSAFVALLESELNATSFEVDNFNEPISSFNGTVTADKEALISLASSLSEKNNIGISPMQKITVNQNEMFIPDANETFAINKGYFEAFVEPGHVADEQIALNLFVIANSRTGLEVVQATESVPGLGNSDGLEVTTN